MREIDEREYVHERLGEDFAHALSNYDTMRRVEVLTGEFLTDEMAAGARTLDVGCGLGFFSEALAARGARVTACDLGPTLVERTRQRAGCEAVVADALHLDQTFEPGSFDLVVSSECIEHTPDPQAAVRQMAAMLRPGGHLALSTPNILWYPVVALATRLRLRPFDGFERFSSWRGLRRVLDEAGVDVLRETGLHLFPFQLGAHALSTWCDERLQGLRGLMINICILGRRRGAE